MYTRLLVIALLLLLAPNGFAQTPGDGKVIAERFRALSRSSTWEKVGEVPMAFPTFHPQGMTIIDDRIYLSSVEVVDRVAGEGVAHLFKADLSGNLLQETRLETGKLYHPSGMSFDGVNLWLAIAEYRPESRSIIMRVSPTTMEAEPLFGFDEHLGLLLGDRTTRSLIALNWGARNYYHWPATINNGALSPAPRTAPVVIANGSHYIDYQDCQVLLGTGFAMLSGVSTFSAGGDSTAVTLGGIELVNLKQLVAQHQIPVPLRTAKGQPIAQYPFHVAPSGQGLRFYFMTTEDKKSKLYSYDVTP
jgi:hypothetical protein